jgi:hypothetical protein
MLSEITNKDVDDVRAMYLEHTKKPTNHRDLWEKIPDFEPMELGEVLRPCREDEFKEHAASRESEFDKALIYKFINPTGLNALPKWDWDSIFTLVDKPK